MVRKSSQSMLLEQIIQSVLSISTTACQEELFRRNHEGMQNMFRMITYGENLSSEFHLILNAWNEKHWIKPELQEQPELMQVKLILLIKNEVLSGSSNDPIDDPIDVSMWHYGKNGGNGYLSAKKYYLCNCF